jgi:muconolactone delta-isomerase
MKYLTIAKPGTTPVPPEQGVGLWQAAKEWINARLADGRLDCHYVFADTGGFAISNADSHEEVFDALLTFPLFAFFDWEVKALCDWSHSYDKIIEVYQQLAS